MRKSVSHVTNVVDPAFAQTHELYSPSSSNITFPSVTENLSPMTGVDASTTVRDVAASNRYVSATFRKVGSNSSPPAVFGKNPFVPFSDDCARRLRDLETFEGDAGAGYVKPSMEAVTAVRSILTSLYVTNPKLESPLISPCPDGEVMISWRRSKSYLILHFDKGLDFEWSFKKVKAIGGIANGQSDDVRRDLSVILLSFLGMLHLANEGQGKDHVKDSLGATLYVTDEASANIV